MMDESDNKNQKDGTHTRVSSRSNPYVYMKVRLTMEGGAEEWTPTRFKYTVTEAMKETLGHVGAATTVDVLKLLPESAAILRVPSKMLESIWAALTLYGNTASGIPCAFRVEKVTPFLMALSPDV